MSNTVAEQIGEYRYGFKTKSKPVFKANKGLTKEIVQQISEYKGEPKWMLDFRLRALEIFMEKPMPTWGGDLSKIKLDEIIYYIKPSDKPVRNWEDVPDEIKETFERLGVPQAEREHLAGSGAQFESEMVYHSLRKDLEEKGVIFEDIDSALKKYPDLF